MIAPPVGAVRAYAPGGIGNLGPGLDVLGCALTGAGDWITVWPIAESGIRVIESGHPDIPTLPTRHAGAVAGAAVLARLGLQEFGIALHTTKGLPLSGGQGGSAASSVAAALAVNALVDGDLDRAELLECALAGESSVAGRHADNVAPALHGGIVLVRSMNPVTLTQLPVPAALQFVLIHPHYRLTTSESRGVLPAQIDRPTMIHQIAQVAAMIVALYDGSAEAFGRAIDDRVAEPARASLLPGFAAAKQAALDAGAFGCSISGAGPTIFAVTDDDDAALRILAASRAAYERAGIESDGRVARVDQRGAYLG